MVYICVFLGSATNVKKKFPIEPIKCVVLASTVCVLPTYTFCWALLNAIMIYYQSNVIITVSRSDMSRWNWTHRKQRPQQRSGLQPTQEKARRGFGNNGGERTRKVIMSKGENLGSRHSMQGYIRPRSRFKKENLWALGSQQRDL